MSDRGSLNMRNLTRALQEVVQWYPVGVALGIPSHKLDTIKISQPTVPLCKISLVDVWLRTDLEASWGKLALALTEAEETTAAGRVKEEFLGILASAPVPPSALTPPRFCSSLDPSGVARSTSYQQRQVGQTIASPLQPAASSMAHNQQQRLLNYHGGTPYHNHGGLTANSHGNGFIASDGPRAPVQAPAPVPVSAQVPVVSNVGQALQLLRTSQERLISGLTHSTLDVNFAGGAAGTPGMTLLHYAAMQGANTECLKALIAFGADVNPLNEHGLTPLDLALMSNPSGGEMVSVLEAVGAVKGRNLTHGCQPADPANCVQPNGVHILSVPSSGPYCIVQLQVLQQIEAQSRHNITNLFQWITACGFGALFLLLIIYGNKAVSEVKRLYFKLREEVFSQPDVARRSQSLDGFLQAHLGTQMKMTDIQHPRIVIGALYKGSTKVEVRLFNNCFHDDYSDVPVWKVARYTCSLPLNIMECDNYVSTDPALPNISSLALRRIRQFYSDAGGDPDVIRCLVCVEAGQCDARELGCIDVPGSVLSDALYSSSPSTSAHWFTSHGALQRLAHLLTLHHSSASAAGEETLQCCRELCQIYDIRLHLFNPLLSRPTSLSFDVPLKDLVESVTETIAQVAGNPLQLLINDINV